MRSGRGYDFPTDYDCAFDDTFYFGCYDQLMVEDMIRNWETVYLHALSV